MANLTSPQDPFQQQVLNELEQIKTDIEKLDYKFDTYRDASDSLVKLATTIIVAASTVAALPSALNAIGPIIQALVAGSGVT